MKTIEMSIDIEAPPEKVFTLATDIERLPERIPSITKIEMLTEGPVGVGTKFRETRVMFKKEATEEMEFTSFDPDHSYVLEAESMGSHYTSTITFTPNGSGTTMTWAFHAEPLSAFSKIAGSLLFAVFAGATRRALLEYLEAIKLEAERD